MTVVTQNKIDILVGMIAPFGMSSVPTGWLACDGSAVSRTTYADLFTAIGTTWGAGDGSSTFALPDLEGAFLRGVGAHNTSNKADGSDFGDASRAVGSFENDALQGHRHEYKVINDNCTYHVSPYINVDKTNSGSNGISTVNGRVFDPITDGSNGTPRTTDETRPFNAGVKYCIKY
tara:strand:- start:5291 stop:5818 length:528 start_codon:yes stop_codon:yes gene_type:complete